MTRSLLDKFVVLFKGFGLAAYDGLVKKKTAWLIFGVVIALVFGFNVYAGETADAGHGSAAAMTFLWIAVILIFAKMAGLVEKLGQPAVLGELVIGVILGNLALLGITLFEPIKHDLILKFLSELGVVILLFQIGLESNLTQMRKVGVRAFLVAIVGVVVPFVLGTYVVGPLLLPGLSANAYLFLGAALTATSVGITARVFQDLNKLKTSEAQIILGAAVIDDVLGLIILAVVSAIVTVGGVTLGGVFWIIAKSVLFLIGAVVIGQFLAKWLGKAFSKISSGVGMKFTLAIAFCLVFAFLAQKIGLAPIVGAFAAGLILDPVHFKYFKKPKIVSDIDFKIRRIKPAIREKINEATREFEHKHIEDIIQQLGYFVVPLFFVMTGMSVKLETLFDVKILLVALGVTAVAFIGKYVSSFVAGKVNRNIVGFGMVPRGEVGLIFAAIGKALGVVSDEIYSVIVIMVILTTLLTPPILAFFIRRQDKAKA